MKKRLEKNKNTKKYHMIVDTLQLLRFCCREKLQREFVICMRESDNESWWCSAGWTVHLFYWHACQ